MLDPPATAAARDEPAEGGIPPTLSQRVLLTLPESSLDVALAASLESKAASRAKIWKGILARCRRERGVLLVSAGGHRKICSHGSAPHGAFTSVLVRALLGWMSRAEASACGGIEV